MKEIKAYVRPGLLETIISRLQGSGIRDLTIVRVDALGAMADWENFRSYIWKTYAETYSKCAKIEFVCHDDEAAGFIKIVEEAAHLGEHGDGRIFVTEIADAINIRTGTRGPQALC